MSEYGCHRSTFRRNTKIFKNKYIFIPDSKDRHLVIYLDGLRVNKKTYLLIASNGKHVIGFYLVDYESSNNWRNFLKKCNEPEYVVCDWQNELIKAIKSVWFNIKIQRCLFHVRINIRQKINIKPWNKSRSRIAAIVKRVIKN